MTTLEQRIAKRVGKIPASGGSLAMELYPSTLSRKLSREMLDEIAKIAVEEMRKEQRPKEDAGSDHRTVSIPVSYFNPVS